MLAHHRLLVCLTHFVLSCLSFRPALAGLVAHWPMEDPAGTTVSDLSGNGHNGTATGTFVTCGCLGQCRIFASAASDYVTIPDHNDFHFTGDFSLAAWVRLADISNSEAKILAKFSSYQSADGYEISIRSDRRFAFEISDPTLVGQTIALWSMNTIETDKCYFLVATRKADRMEVYINASIEGETSSPTQVLSDPAAIRIGNRALGPDDQGFPGEIDDLRVYDHALSQAEIDELYRCAPQEVQLCPFDASDTNCDGILDILDVVQAVTRVFRNGSPLSPCCPFQ